MVNIRFCLYDRSPSTSSSKSYQTIRWVIIFRLNDAILPMLSILIVALTNFDIKCHPADTKLSTTGARRGTEGQILSDVCCCVCHCPPQQVEVSRPQIHLYIHVQQHTHKHACTHSDTLSKYHLEWQSDQSWRTSTHIKLFTAPSTDSFHSW